MNPFEYFLELRKKILQDEEFMNNLRTYAFTERAKLIENEKVVFLGAGQDNSHFRIGKIGNIWLASRELNDYQFYCWEEYENYITKAVEYHKKEKRVPIVCGGVMKIYKEMKEDERYFLLLEDLTNGGASDFQPAPRDGTINGKLKGEDVYYDFNYNDSMMLTKYYLAKENLIILEE